MLQCVRGGGGRPRRPPPASRPATRGPHFRAARRRTLADRARLARRSASAPGHRPAGRTTARDPPDAQHAWHLAESRLPPAALHRRAPPCARLATLCLGRAGPRRGRPHASPHGRRARTRGAAGAPRSGPALKPAGPCSAAGRRLLCSLKWRGLCGGPTPRAPPAAPPYQLIPRALAPNPPGAFAPFFQIACFPRGSRPWYFAPSPSGRGAPPTAPSGRGASPRRQLQSLPAGAPPASPFTARRAPAAACRRRAPTADRQPHGQPPPRRWRINDQSRVCVRHPACEPAAPAAARLPLAPSVSTARGQTTDHPTLADAPCPRARERTTPAPTPAALRSAARRRSGAPRTHPSMPALVGSVRPSIRVYAPAPIPCRCSTPLTPRVSAGTCSPARPAAPGV
jgi:hypothetical protein